MGKTKSAIAILAATTAATGLLTASGPAKAVTLSFPTPVSTDLFLDKALVSSNDETSEVAALATILGVDASSLTFVDKIERVSLERVDNPDPKADQFVLNVNPQAPSYFGLKFGVKKDVENVYFFRNQHELSLLVFENSQVDGLITIDDLPSDTKLSHYTLVDGAGVSIVPLPASALLLVSAIGGAGFICFRRRRLPAA